jgi:hypothetical protein
MSELAIPTGKKSKKAIRKTIQEKLSITLADYRNVIGEKKFENRIRKAARLLGADILKSLPKKKKAKKEETVTEEAPQ